MHGGVPKGQGRRASAMRNAAYVRTQAQRILELHEVHGVTVTNLCKRFDVSLKTMQDTLKEARDANTRKIV